MIDDLDIVIFFVRGESRRNKSEEMTKTGSLGGVLSHARYDDE